MCAVAARFCGADGVGVTNVTVTTDVDVAELPYLSVAVQVIVDGPAGNVESGAGLHVTEALGSAMSRTDGRSYEITAGVPVVNVLLMSGMVDVNVGAVVSCIVILWVALAVLPELSVAV